MKTMINVKTDVTIKKKAQTLARGLGLPLGTVINSYLRQFIADQRIEFSLLPVPNKRTSRLLDRALKDIESGKNLSPVFSSGQEMDRYLRRR